MNEKKWIFNVRRESTVFSASIMTEAFGLSKNIEIRHAHKNVVYINKEWWFINSEFIKMKKALQSLYDKDFDYFKKIIAKQNKLGNELKKYIHFLDDKYKQSININYLSDFKEYYEKTLEFYSLYLFITSGAGEVFEKKLKEIFTKKNINIDFNEIIFPSCELELTRARKELLRIGLKLNLKQASKLEELDEAQSKSLVSYAKKYGWESYSFHIGKILKPRDYFEKLKSIDVKNEIQEIKKAEKSQKKILKQIKKLLSAKEFEILTTLQGIIYFRNFQKETMNECQYLSLSYLRSLATHLNINLEDIYLLTPNEIINILKNRKKDNFEEIRLRNNGFNIILKNKKCLVVLNKFKKNNRKTKRKKIEEIIGQSAQKGEAKGVVRIIGDKKELEKFKKGEILVTSMTSVDFIEAIKNSKAIITDEGGVTCHAAILSREFKKPCIIGTKIATQVLKDGDLVEVDADKGVVRIIKKYKK